MASTLRSISQASSRAWSMAGPCAKSTSLCRGHTLAAKTLPLRPENIAYTTAGTAKIIVDDLEITPWAETEEEQEKQQRHLMGARILRNLALIKK